MFNYAILTTHFSNLHSMWDFTYTCTLNNLPLTCESPLCELQDLSVGHKQVLLMHHPWAFMCQPRTSFILLGNLASHRCLAPLAIILLSWTFFKIVCVGFMGLLGAIYCPHSNCERDTPCSVCERASSTHTLFPL